MDKSTRHVQFHTPIDTIFSKKTSFLGILLKFNYQGQIISLAYRQY
ncbi:Uncharacterised protein [Yersinia enterocolitica]|uniref:Uncharacterized protein n=2 Tax=Yersinia enterocolitica TaxID=630 RepID=A0A0H3NLW6_YERE1|nr:hypothetical protein YE105_C0117 [Yersinia enterocolitica subsp. palearctica 105.5R(r)]AJI82722.1 hypothetical protein CH47_3380 [Yersinia enterocolitica]EHB20217.1 hypothetical protein IOK_14125 [Yersinia enterocolitica subsp. palearctica PhRBD_Ye1]EKA25360.1 hypothetical protein YWA314_19402 [Yersinia enterocolitica subsp. enterocolitica WA-314]EOR67207.1 hypothetical protein YE149_13553 [Yersinia enterocolitica subsp. palearctica YE-149]EOR75094.1 hypothetical protein YE150_13486 [Yersin